FSVGMFPVGGPLMEDAHGDMPKNTLPAPQLVMLANVAAVTAAETGDGSAADEKEMMELKTVGCSYSDSEEENVVSRYSYNNQSYREVCILEYPESPSPNIVAVVVGNEAEEEEGVKAEDLSRHTKPRPSAKTEKKKPFHCKPCHFQAQNEQEFVEHLGTHVISKMMVVNRVEGRSNNRTKEATAPEAQEAESGEEAAGDLKGLIRCERCGYNTNRYDHYIAHLKHHNKEGEDHRVFKCTLCPYTTVSQYHWRKHLRNHFPSKLHTCSQCSYFSDRKSNYIQHIRTHTGIRPFQCPYCDYSSSQKTHLTRHMRTHSGERPFKCESCNYLAANQHEVTRHARQVHNGPKPLSCPYCEYKTADRSNFKKHVELHLNPRQFLCPLCKYAASKKCNLQYHIKSRHSGCDVTLDVSKVKLRVKKAGPDGVEENQDSVASKEEEEEEESSSPINLSIKKSTRIGIAQPAQTEAPERPPKKSSLFAEKEKLQKVKEKGEPEKRVTTRQKKTEKVLKNPLESEATSADKGQRRVKKKTVQDQAAVTKPDQMDRSNQLRPEEEKARRQKEEEKLRPEKEGHQKNASSRKKNKSLNKLRKSRSKSENIAESVVEAQQKTESPEKKKAAKRKAAEALDLSKSSSSETPSKARRLKEKLQVKPAPADTKEKKTRNTGRRSRSLQQTVDPVKDQKTPGGPRASAEPDRPMQKKTSTGKTSPTLPEKTPNNPPCHSGEDTPPPDEDRPPPTFVKPTSPPSLVLPGQRHKPSDPEEDEGIHSSHEGGSDISDSASEGSEDSGLNGAGSGKMTNDPETPTEEIPTPTELKSHLCIFCDRTFPLEAEYRRHLNRHLVNVYYMEDSARAPQ
uniref:C2H2-type domain-containing protein n=1 Tax=Gasterosteus aculeatus TaxID=69293 RepID=G3PVA0_GASAC